MKHSKTKLKAPQNLACVESKFPDACSLLSRIAFGHLKLTPGQFPQGPTQEKTEEKIYVWAWGRGIKGRINRNRLTVMHRHHVNMNLEV